MDLHCLPITFCGFPDNLLDSFIYNPNISNFRILEAPCIGEVPCEDKESLEGHKYVINGHNVIYYCIQVAVNDKFGFQQLKIDRFATCKF